LRGEEEAGVEEDGEIGGLLDHIPRNGERVKIPERDANFDVAALG
jgi:hypothetical protein